MRADTRLPPALSKMDFGTTRTPYFLPVRTMNLRKFVAPLLAAVQLVCILPSIAVPSSTAVVTEAKGAVFKRDFVDWQREQWGNPCPAAIGDHLHEGMQLGTGEKSYAQLTWPNVTTRAWANSVYAVAPNQRIVYLMGGEMLYHLDKNRKDKSEFLVWTNLLQARVRGTTLLVQCTPNTSRITVLEGCIDVMNRIDKSVVRLKPGVVYEAKSDSLDGNSRAELIPTDSGALVRNAANLIPISERDIPVPLFKSKRVEVTLYKADTLAILNHPLLVEFTADFPSIGLINQALTPLSKTVKTALTLISSAAGILRVPTLCDYAIGTDVLKNMKLPPLALESFPPVGYIVSEAGNAVTSIITFEQLSAARAATAAVPAITGAAGQLVTPVVGNLSTATGTALGAAGSTVAGAISAVGSIGSSVGTLSGAASTLSGTTSALSSTVSALGSAVSSVTAVIPTALPTALPTTLPSTLTTTVTTTLSPVTSTTTSVLPTAPTSSPTTTPILPALPVTPLLPGLGGLGH